MGGQDHDPNTAEQLLKIRAAGEVAAANSDSVARGRAARWSLTR